MKLRCPGSFTRRLARLNWQANVRHERRLFALRVAMPLMRTAELRDELTDATAKHIRRITALHAVRVRWWELPAWRRWLA